MHRSRAADHGGYVDLHIHTLPGLDDGPETFQESVNLLHASYLGGTRTVVATPHMYHAAFPEVTHEGVRSVYRQTCERLARLSTRSEFRFLADMSMALGAENFATSDFLDDLENGGAITLNDGRHVLIEFSSYFTFNMIRATLARVMDCGFHPVVAHIERYPALMANEEGIEYLFQSGCTLQVNKDTLEGGRLSPERRQATRLLKKGWIQVLASDGHRATGREPNFAAAARVLRRTQGRDVVNRLLVENPGRIIGEVEPLAPRPRSIPQPG